MFHHITVLKAEATEGLRIKPDGIYVDCTLGGGGHSSVILSKLGPKGKLIAFDQDDWALDNAKQLLASHSEQLHLIKSNFEYLEEKLSELEWVPKVNGIPQVDGILFDLGVSSPQFDEGERGFSYNADAVLDMRMDQDAELTAREIINEWSESEIARILHQYGEEKFSRRIAKVIVKRRQEGPINTTEQLVELIKEGIPAAARRTGGHPAKRSFQALRIAVNDELGVLKKALHASVRCLAPEGRVSVITFHSLEDRICKQIFASYVEQCTCPPDFPLCVCGAKGELKLINRKPLIPSDEEIALNPRARSAKLRVAEKLHLVAEES